MPPPPPPPPPFPLTTERTVNRPQTLHSSDEFRRSSNILFSRPPSSRDQPFPSLQLDDVSDVSSEFTSYPDTPTPASRRPFLSTNANPNSRTLTMSPGPIRRRLSSNNSTPRSSTPRDRFIPSTANVQSFRMGSTSPATRTPRSGRAAAGSPNTATGSDAVEGSFFPVYNPGSARTIGLGGPTSPARLAAAHQTGYAGGSPGAGGQRTISAGSVGVFGIGIIAGGAGSGSPGESGHRVVNGNVFNNKESQEQVNARHENLLSQALEVDRDRRVLEFGGEQKDGRKEWWPVGTDATGVMGSAQGGVGVDLRFYQTLPAPGPVKKQYVRHVPTTPFRVLDAPGLRDDFYCSLLAYSPQTHSLAVGLNSDVYSWAETSGARPFEHWSSSHVTSLAFSTLQGGSNILAIGRIDGSLTLWNPAESQPRVEQQHPAGVACIAWKPTLTKKHHSEASRNSSLGYREYVEELLVGDEMGNIHIYAVDWNTRSREATIVLLRRMPVHTQQICGLAWSPDGTQFVTGGNDNMAYLFDTAVVVERDPRTGLVNQEVEPRAGEVGERYRWPHGAAVKAIAFCPWQKSLVATGGGSNDRCIHFYHTFSGAKLAAISVAAQVTSLLWSHSRREIAATFGYANPDHPIRIAVFSWPECRQIVAVPWQEEMRALYAVAYPGGPAVCEGKGYSGEKNEDSDDEDEAEDLIYRSIVNSGGKGVSPATKARMRERQNEKAEKKSGSVVGIGNGARRRDGKLRPVSEGCIVVAASDETVRFHEVWSEHTRGVLGWKGVLGGSDILEELEGIEDDRQEVIR